MGRRQATGKSTGVSLIRLAPVLGLLLAATPAAAQSPEQSPAQSIELPLYSAEYSITAKLGILSFGAETRSRTEWDADTGEYRYTTEAEASGVAGAMFPGTGVDVSRFRLDCNGLIPIEHRRDDGSSKRDEDLLASFDADAGLARVNYQGQDLEIPTPPGTVDANSLPLAMMLDLLQGRDPGTYAALDRDEVKTYRITVLGRESMDSVLGKVDTLVIEQSKPGSSRSRKIWLLEAHDYLPVRMEYRRKGKTRTVMTLDKLEQSGHGPRLECDGPVSNAQPPSGEPG